MMGLSVVSQKVGPPSKILAPSRRVWRGREVAASSSAMSSIAGAKRQRWQVLWTVCACLFAGTIAQEEGSSVVPHQTPSRTREISRASLVSFQNSTEAGRTVGQGLRNHSTESQLDLRALGRSLYTRNSAADLEGPASTSSDPSKASGLLRSGSPDVQVDTKSSEVLDSTTSSLGGGLVRMETSLAPPSTGLKDSPVATSVSQPVEKEKAGLTSATGVFPTFSPTLPPLPDTGSSSRSDVNPALQIARSHPLRGTTLNTPSSIAQPTAATLLPSAKPPAPEVGTQGGQELPVTSLPVTRTDHWTLLDQKSPSHSSDDLPSAEMGFLSHQAAKGASVSPQRLGTSPPHSTLPAQRVPSEATRAPTDVFYSSRGVTARRFLGSTRPVSARTQPGSLPTESSASSSRSVASLQEAALKGQGPELLPRDSFLGTAVPTMLSQSSRWPSPSHSHEVVRATLPDFATQMGSSETKGLGTHRVSEHGWFPTNVGSPKLDGATASSVATDGAQVTPENDTESPLSVAPVMEKLGTHYGVSEGLVHDFATVPALTSDQTPSPSSTPQDSPGSEATSGFPFSNTSLLESHIPGSHFASSPRMTESTARQGEMGTIAHSPYPSPAGLPGVHLSLSTTPLERDAIAPSSPTEAVPSTHGRTTLGEESTSSGSASWADLAASLGATEEQGGSPGTDVLPSASPGEWEDGVSPAAEPPTDVPRLDASSPFLPAHASSLPTFSVPHSGDAKTRYSVPFLHSWAPLSTGEAIPSTDVADSGSSREQRQPEVHDGTGQITAAAAATLSASTSEPPRAASGAAVPADASSLSTSAMPGPQPAWKHFTIPGAKTRPSSSSSSSSSSLPSSTFPAASRMTDSKESSEPKTWAVSLLTEGARSTSVSTSTARSDATVSPQFLDLTGVVQPLWTTAAGEQHVGMLPGSPLTSPARELFSGTPSEWGRALPTLSRAVASRTEVMDTARAGDTSTVFFAPSASDRGSSKVPANLSLAETKSTVMTHPVVSLSSNATTLLSSSGILPTASALITRAACSDVPCLNNALPASFTPLQRTSTQLPMTSQTLPQKVLVTTWGSTAGKKGTVAGHSTKPGTPKVTHATALTSMEPGTIMRDGPTSKQRVSTWRASMAGQTAPGGLVSLSKHTLDVHILTLQFRLVRVDYTESLENTSSARYQKLEREVVLTLNKMLSSYENFLQAKVLRFLHGSVIAQSEATFRGEGLLPTPSDFIRTVVTAVEQRELDTFFDWRVDLKSVRCNGFTLKNLEPEVLALSFTVLGWGSIAVFGGLTGWRPLEKVRNEVVLSLETRYRVQNFSLVQVRNMQGDLDVSGDIYVNTEAHVDIGWALEALKGLVNYSVHLGSICINGSRLSLQIFPVSFLVTNRLFSEKLLDRSSAAHQTLSWDLSRALTHMLGQYKNLLQVTIRELRSGSLICHGDVIFVPPAPTSKDVVHTLALSVGPKNYLGASNLQVDPFSFTVAGAKLEPPSADGNIPGYGIALIVLSCLAVIGMPLMALLYHMLGRKDKIVIHRVRDPEVMVETFELDNPGFRSLAEDNRRQPSPPTEVLG